MKDIVHQMVCNAVCLVLYLCCCHTSSIILCFSCDPEFFQSVCTSISVRSTEEAEQLASLLRLLGFSLLLAGELPRKTCRSVGRVLRLCGSDVDLVLTPRKMSVRGASLLFRRSTQLHSLRFAFIQSLAFFLITPSRPVNGKHHLCHDCFFSPGFPMTWPCYCVDG